MSEDGPQRGKLSDAVNRALVILLHDRSAYRQGRKWISNGSQVIHWRTIEGMFDLRLIYMISRGSKPLKHSVKLTDIGRHVACNIDARVTAAFGGGPPHNICEESARFITEVV